MKKNIIVFLVFCILLSVNANAGKNVIFNGFTPKNEISDHKDSKKLKTIQKIFNTKIGKWILKKVIKKLQKKHIGNTIKSDIKSKKATKNRANIIIVSLGISLMLGGIKLLIDGSTLLGVILGVLGLTILIIFVYFASLTSNN